MTPAARSGLIIREREPLNLESPFDQLTDLLTPADLFYIRNHFPVPDLTAEDYRLELSGAVERPVTMSLAELQRLPAETRLATLECAGNSRVFLHPQTAGAQWELGAVGTAEWTGVPLGRLLECAGVKPSACEVVLAGADQGQPKEPPKPPAPLHYARSLPLRKALAPEVLVAWAMNGRPLTPDHGFPVRAIVPGHYGMASVKWLTGVQVVTRPFQGYWQTTDYAYWAHEDGQPVRRPLSSMPIKSAISRPRMYESVAAGASYTVLGAAWSGENQPVAVEVSSDGGATWRPAEFLDPACRFTWRRWRFPWQAPSAPGCYLLLSRSTNDRGETQPAEHDANFGSYAIHHTLGVKVQVGASSTP